MIISTEGSYLDAANGRKIRIKFLKTYAPSMTYPQILQKMRSEAMIGRQMVEKFQKRP